MSDLQLDKIRPEITAESMKQKSFHSVLDSILSVIENNIGTRVRYPTRKGKIQEEIICELKRRGFTLHQYTNVIDISWS